MTKCDRADLLGLSNKQYLLEYQDKLEQLGVDGLDTFFSLEGQIEYNDVAPTTSVNVGPTSLNYTECTTGGRRWFEHGQAFYVT